MGHWYQKDGKPLYQVEKSGSKGKRDTTLADAKKLHLVPSVTGITGLIAKPQLDKWKIDQVMNTVCSFPIKDDESHTDYIKRILSLSKEKMEVASNRGTEIHDKLEEWFLTGKFDEIDKKFLEPVIEKLYNKFPDNNWVAEQSFASHFGFGGKVDLYSEEGVIVDFKTKAKDKLDSKMLYFDYCIQLAAYREGLKLKNAKGYNLLISTTVPGEILLYEWPEKDLNKGLQMFKCMLELWKHINNFDSSWEE